MYLRTIKNRPSLLICEHDLQSIIHYVDVGDRAIIQLPDGQANGQIKGIFPKGLTIRIWDGEIGTIKFFQWYKIIEIKKLKVKHKVGIKFLQIKNTFIIIGLISILTIGMLLLYMNIN